MNTSRSFFPLWSLQPLPACFTSFLLWLIPGLMSMFFRVGLGSMFRCICLCRFCTNVSLLWSCLAVSIYNCNVHCWSTVRVWCLVARLATLDAPGLDWTRSRPLALGMNMDNGMTTILQPRADSGCCLCRQGPPVGHLRRRLDASSDQFE